jgi:hypothetical protein
MEKSILVWNTSIVSIHFVLFVFQVWEEVPADGVYCLESKPKSNSQRQLVETFNFNHFKLKKYPWSLVSKNLESNAGFYIMQVPVKPFNKELPSESDLECLGDELKQEQSNGLRKDVQCSSQLPARTNTDKTRTLEMKDLMVKIEHKSDTSNLQRCCEVGECSTHKHAKLNVLEETSELERRGIDCFSTLAPKHPSSPQLMITKEATSHPDDINTLKELCNKVIISTREPNKFSNSCKNIDKYATSWNTRDTDTLRLDVLEGLPESFVGILGESVRKRVFNLPRFFSASKKQELKCESHGNSTSTKLHCHNKELLTKETHGSTNEDGQYSLGCSRVGVLFSGGIDSIVLAALADR